jgi:hypothetical protein
MTDARRGAKELGAHGLGAEQGIGASDRTRTGDIQNHNLAL